MQVVAMFGSLFVTTGQSTGECCGKSRRGNKNREGGWHNSWPADQQQTTNSQNLATRQNRFTKLLVLKA